MQSRTRAFGVFVLLVSFFLALPIAAAPDVAVIEIRAPVFLVLGGQNEVGARISNLGIEAASAFQYRVVLSKTNTITLYDPVFFEGGPITLEPGAEIDLTAQVVIPDTFEPGWYYLGFLLDPEGELPDSNRANDVMASADPSLVFQPAPHLRVREVLTCERGAAGETIRVDFTIENRGQVGADFDYGIYLSLDSTLGNIPLFRAAMNLQSGESTRRTDYALLPPGLPAGEYYLDVVADPDDELDTQHETWNIARSALPLQVEEAALRIATSWLPEAKVDQHYAWRFLATGGSGNYLFSLAQGELPAGMTFSPALAEIHGVPEGTGDFFFVLEVVSGELSTSSAYVLRVAPRTLTLAVSTEALLPAIAETGYEMRLSAMGGRLPYIWSAEGLPSGLVMDPAGLLHGEPAQAGSFNPTFCVRDDTGDTSCRTLFLRVLNSGDFAILTGLLPEGMVGETYWPVGLETIGATGLVTWSVVDGLLPPGVTLSATLGILRGTPTSAGRFTFRLRALDEAGFTDTNNYSIEVGVQELRISTDALAPAEVGVAYEQALELGAGQGREPYRFGLLSGVLPMGLVLDQAAGAILGTPVEGSEGRYTLGIRVQDSAGAEGIRAYVLTVSSPQTDERLAVQPYRWRGCESGAGGGPLFASALLFLFLLLLAKRKPAGAALALVLLIIPSSAWSQEWIYATTTVPHTYQQIQGGTVLTALSNKGDAFTRVALPFPVEFFGQTYQEFYVCSNGFVAFEPLTAAHYANSSIPNTAAPNGIVALWWTDLSTETAKAPNSEISTAVLGSAPNRVFVVQYEEITVYQGTYHPMNFQLRLYEGSTTIETHYGPIAGTSAGAASVGIENQTGTTGLLGLSCTPTCGGTDFPTNHKVAYGTNPHLMAIEVNASATMWVGVPTPVSGTVTNRGGEDSGAFDIIAVISPTLKGILQGTEIGRTQVSPGLAAGQSRAVSMTATPPQGLTVDQDYWLSLIPNPEGETPDAGGGRNFAPPIQVRIGAPTPIIRVSSVTPGATQASRGGELQVTTRLANRGSLPADTSFWVVLSGNEVISKQDLFLHEESVTLPPLADLNRSITMTLPPDIAVGSYYVGVILDPDGVVGGPSLTGYTGASAAPIAVVGDSVVIMTPSVPQGRIGRAYATQLQAAGGEGAYRWRVTSGSLPPGLTLSESGWIEGRPTLPEEGTVSGPPWLFQFQALVRSGPSLAAQASISLIVDDDSMPLAVVTRDLPNGAVDFDYRAQLFAAGGTRPYRWSLHPDVNALPGLLLTEDGRLLGVPTEAGSFDLVIEVEDSGGEIDSFNAVVEIGLLGHLTIETTELPPGLLGETYSSSLEAVGGSAPYRWALDVAAPLPQGLTLSEGGLIEGTPEQVGAFDIVVTVTDADERSKIRSLDLVIGYTEGISIVTTRLPQATSGRDYEAALSTWGGLAPFEWSIVSGSLPTGLALEGNAGLILGVPAGDDIHRDIPFILKVEDSAGRSAIRALSISVGPPPAVLEAEGCSVLGGGSRSAFILLLVGAAVFGLRGRFRPERRGRPASAGGLTVVLLGLFLAVVSCGEQNLCEDVACPAGTFCSVGDGECRCGGPSGELCAADQTCDPVSGLCHSATNPCAGISCTDGLTCDPDDGGCKCGGAGGSICQENEQCDPSSGDCVAPEQDPCVGVVCADDELCDPSSGQCRCGEGPSCPVGERCEANECVAFLCHGVACADGNLCDPADGRCRCGGAGGMICLADEVCDPGNSECIPAGLCMGIGCPFGMSCDPEDATCKCGGPGGAVCEDHELCSPTDGLCYGGAPCHDVSCEAGMTCDPSDGVCRCGGPGGLICQGEERCFSPDEQEPFCSLACSWPLQDCPDDLGCYREDVAQSFFCSEAGTTDRGFSCEVSSDCRPGMVCLGQGHNRTCRTLCSLGVLPPAPGSCDAQSDCQPWAELGSELGICVSSQVPLDLGAMLAPDIIDFGEVQTGCAGEERLVCFYNTGGPPLTVTGVTLDGPSDGSMVLGGLPPELTGGGVIDVAGESGFCFTAQFLPTETGPRLATIEMTTAQHTAPIVGVLEGRGIAGAAVTERIAQSDRSKIDLLFVVDDSASMTFAQERLSTGIASVMTHFTTRGIDYHVGVITTSVMHQGGLLQPVSGARPHIVSPNIPDPLETLQQNVLVGTTGEVEEKGFLAAELCFHPLNDTSNKNGGFLRQDAYLAIVFVSDEPEQSLADVDYYLSYFLRLKSFRQEMVTASAFIVLAGESCGGASGPFPRYEELVARTGGMVFSICLPDWSQELELLSATVLGNRSSFALIGEPTTGTLQVAVLSGGSGAPVHPPYEYDPAAGAVVFSGAAIPEFGDVVEVSFEAQCRQ